MQGHTSDAKCTWSVGIDLYAACRSYARSNSTPFCICSIVFLFKFWPRTFTIELCEKKKPTWSEIMILECSFRMHTAENQTLWIYGWFFFTHNYRNIYTQKHMEKKKKTEHAPTVHTHTNHKQLSMVHVQGMAGTPMPAARKNTDQIQLWNSCDQIWEVNCPRSE